MSNNGTFPNPQIVIFEASEVIDVRPALHRYGGTVHIKQCVGLDRDGNRWSFRRDDCVLASGTTIPGWPYDFVSLTPSESE
ncbi:MAG: hypothetical protein JW910_22760 [Anaerolineae bacterium]|nr:hypothetical protein [Anaerolineae bacterium]